MKWDAVLYYERMDGIEEGLTKGRIEGQLEAKIEDIFSFLEDLGDIPDELKDKIQNETDLEILSKWLKLAGRAESIEDFIEKI